MENKQEQLKKFVARRHPEYDDMLPHWEFLEDCYEGGREWFHGNIFRYIKEGDKEYGERVARSYRFNHTREVVDLVDKYLFKMEVARNLGDASDCVKEFWKEATLNKLSIKDLIKQVSKQTSIYGRVWIVVDNTKGDDVETLAEEKQADVRTYAYIVTPENALDMSYDDEGELNWILIHEQGRDDENPLTSSGDLIDRFRLWERDQWTLFEIVPKHTGNKVAGFVQSAADMAIKVANIARGGKVGEIATISPDANSGSNYDVEVIGPVAHSFGSVPVFAADNIISSELYTSQSLIDDVAYLDRAVANYLSNLDAIIQDQTFSQLIIPAQGLTPGETGYDKLLEAGTKRAFTYDAEGGGKPEFISPDVKQAEVILKVINKIINEIYHTVGLAGERTKEDNALGIDNSSGVAKAYDFERVNSLLAAKADSLQNVENRLVEFVEHWNSVDDDLREEEELVAYPDNFDVRGLYDEFEIATRLSLIQAPEGVRRLQMEAVIDKLFPKLKADLKAKMIEELKVWPQKIDPNAPLQDSGTALVAKAVATDEGK